MAILAEKQGNMIEALEYFTQTVHAYTCAYGAEHPTTIYATNAADQMRGTNNKKKTKKKKQKKKKKK